MLFMQQTLGSDTLAERMVDAVKIQFFGLLGEEQKIKSIKAHSGYHNHHHHHRQLQGPR